MKAAKEIKETKERRAPEKITKEMNISELIEKCPEAGRILFEEGIHCFGCAAAHFETLEEGLMAHGKGESDIKKIVEKLNKAAQK
ncbi:MAG: DUF1858 domain-containing protein [Nanoarchaeota archaeon]